MFQWAKAFNGDLSSWNVSNVTNMEQVMSLRSTSPRIASFCLRLQKRDLLIRLARCSQLHVSWHYGVQRRPELLERLERDEHGASDEPAFDEHSHRVLF